MNITLLSLILIILAVGAVIFIDVYVNLKTWLARIKIGRVSDTATYEKLIASKAYKWFEKTPTVKLTDNSRLVLFDILKGNYKRSTIQHWQKAGLLLGLTSNRNSIHQVSITQLLYKKHPNEIPLESDYVIYAYALLEAANKEEQSKFRSYFDAVYNMLNKLKGEQSVVPYKSYTGRQMYVDTIGFICPFLFLYGKTYNIPAASEMAIQQIAEFNKYGMYPNTFLPCHTYNTNKDISPAGLFGWGRGLGWYAIGLIDVWKMMSVDDKDYPIVTSWVINYAKTILQFQQADGAWSWNVLVDSSRKDSSTTVMLAWFLINAAAIEDIKAQSQNAVQRSIAYLKTVTRRDGALDFCQGDTKGIGIYSQTFDILPFAQGYLLRILTH